MNQNREVETRTAQFEVCSAVANGKERSGRSAAENFMVNFSEMRKIRQNIMSKE